MRRVLALATFLVPSTLVLAHGCGDGETDEPEIEDLCGWLADPENCYREFGIDVGVRCGAFGRGQAPQGSFKTRQELDVCILQTQNGAEYQGGQVIFEPPLDLTAFNAPPVDGVFAPPQAISFQLIKNDGTQCGFARFKDKYDFSIVINGDPVPDGGTNEDLVEGGAYEQTGLEGRDVLDVTCPKEEKHYFDRLQVTKCTSYEDILPHAEMDFNPGSVGINGVVRLRVFYPPVEGELDGASPYEVEYFECIIPAAPEPCEDQAQNGNETDIDCGGPDCPRKCDDDQKCQSDSDCRETLSCQLIQGLKKCKEIPGG